MSTNLPANWHVITGGALSEHLNDRRRRPTPQATVDAITHAVRARGVSALQEPAQIERLSRCDEHAKALINKTIATVLRGKAS
jgi:hypothetical protein